MQETPGDFLSVDDIGNICGDLEDETFNRQIKELWVILQNIQEDPLEITADVAKTILDAAPDENFKEEFLSQLKEDLYLTSKNPHISEEWLLKNYNEAWKKLYDLYIEHTGGDLHV